jgi:bifunctional non-homologous end joining protein LigD
VPGLQIDQDSAYIRRVLRKNPFIRPMAPTAVPHAPVGVDWLHEVKFDGWRAQLHVEGDAYTLYSKNGADFTKRFKQLAPLAKAVPAKTAIIDCELVACDERGMPCFRTLMELGNKATLCLVAFDLLHLNGVRLTPIAIEERKATLKSMVARIGSPYFQFSDSFDDPEKLLEACVEHDLEGIVSKRRGSAYQSGPTRDWVKTKTAAWKLANKRRWERFGK